MAPPLNRREFLRTVAVSSAAVGGAAFAVPGRAQRMPAFSRALPGGEWHYPARADLIPFGHAVASGDPLADRVILWTRITIPDIRGWDVNEVPDPQGIESVDVAWVIATDPELTQVVNGGMVSTDASRDFTVKIDADGLQPATTYWYAFTALGFRSPIGRTRTAPTAGQGVAELTIGHVACTSWWQDVFNGYARMGERGDIDLITHAGDHVYEVSGNHMSSRQYPDKDGNPQLRPYDDIDNRAWRSVGECRRRYALYYQDSNLIAAHLGAPFAIMADQHDYDDASDGDTVLISRAQAGEVYHEWCPLRSPIPDGSGRFPESPGPNTNVPVPRGDDAFYSYRSLNYGDVAEIVLIDIRRHRDSEATEMQILGDRQWQWLQETLLAAKARGARHNIIVNQINMSQVGTINTPLYDQYAEAFQDAFGFDPRGPELYTSGWGGYPDNRRTLYRWLRDNEILDNIVLSGDSHGWFGSDLTEDPQAPNYVPLTGLSPLQPVGVEMVGTSMGRPGAQDVVADELYWAANGGRDSAPFDDAQTYDSVYRPIGLVAATAIETAAKVANLNLIYFNWRSQFGHTMVHLRQTEAVLENWVSPQREMSDTAELVAQLTTPLGNPHLRPALLPAAVVGARDDPAAPMPETIALDLPDAPGPSRPPTGSGGALALGSALVLALAGVLGRLRARQGGSR
ncbi:alkaline phosphatase D family protein [uncultured Abyssibacter sp.]|mgnify:FL=1|uniref:alkaline phosphatase D family protein n=1 Tax=uncultured Abyssibacter sp. TaxID=2320202 RepID=UPI0032B1F6A0